MPRTNLQKKFCTKPQPPINYLSELFRRYMMADGITQTAIGEGIGYSHSNISLMLRRPVTEWKIGDIKKVCDYLECPIEDAFHAILNSDGIKLQ